MNKNQFLELEEEVLIKNKEIVHLLGDIQDTSKLLPLTL
jgi:hypothetical protein